MRYRYFICDVFTDQRFCGNQLAVLPDAEGLSGEQMQAITREFNYSESTFVLPPDGDNTRKVRIFTPANEIPFAGHPNIGTAYALALDGQFGTIRDDTTVSFEEGAGIVDVLIERTPEGKLRCELKTPQSLTLGEAVDTGLVASLLSLETEDIVTTTHPPQSASVGLPFLIVELASLDALARARFDFAHIDAIHELGAPHDVLMYVHTRGEFAIRDRMFAPLDGVPEDPATGSANCALAALLTHYQPEANGEFQWRIQQGVEMGRPSVLDARTEKRHGKVTGTWIAGDSVLVSEGWIEID